jgi:D-arabinose 1-dehydrogenase-like Zn-dependent alcohol dehydrogenase
LNNVLSSSLQKDMYVESTQPWSSLTDVQILAKVLASGVCHSDMLVGQGGFGNPFPIIPGHEVVAEVVAVPSTEKRWKVGDWVGGAWHGGHCGAHEVLSESLLDLS